MFTILHIKIIPFYGPSQIIFVLIAPSNTQLTLFYFITIKWYLICNYWCQ